MMNESTLRELIKTRLVDGSLPHDVIGKFWAGQGQGELCDGCLRPVTHGQVLMEADAPDDRTIRFHAACQRVWMAERLQMQS